VLHAIKMGTFNYAEAFQRSKARAAAPTTSQYGSAWQNLAAIYITAESDYDTHPQTLNSPVTATPFTCALSRSQRPG